MYVDLETGKTRESRREDYCTKIAAVRADPNCPTPLWTQFLDRVTDHDVELQNYLQRMVGYCMTGDTIEHVLFFLYGTGANGKSVFINTIVGIFNDYAVIAPMELFLQQKNPRHETELAHLWGARLVVAQEIERGRQWAEAKIKTLTGGDKITARFMRQDFFDFTPQFKIMIAGNHKPSLRGVDEAIRRRLHLIPFTITIPAEKRDHKLFEKLKPEWPGILQWMINGSIEWHKTGLAPPKAVVDASEAYFEEEDRIGQWIEEDCEEGSGFEELIAVLFTSWKQWAENNNEFCGSEKAFRQTLDERKYGRKRQGGTGKTQVTGLRLKRRPTRV
jgi:putative DNA primase/helicase